MTGARTHSLLRTIWSVLRPSWLGLVAVLLLIPVGAALEVMPPFILKRVVDDHLKAGLPSGLGLLATLYILSFVAIQTVAFLQTYTAAGVGQGALRDLRLRLFRHLASLPVSYFDRTPTGDTVSRCTADVEAMGMLFSSTILGVFAQLARLVGIVGAMVALNARLALVALLAVPVIAVVARLFQAGMLIAERETRQRVGDTNTQLQENLTGMEVLRAFKREGSFERRFGRTQEGYLRASDRSSLYDSVFSPIIHTLRAVVIALLLWYGCRPEVFVSWGVTLGVLVAFVHLLDRFFEPITALGQEYQTVQRAVAGAERIHQILWLEPEPRPPSRPLCLRPGALGLRVEQVTFGYASGQPVLEELSLAVEPGEHAALVGQTAAGKTSLMHLIAGLYVPDRGTVRVGDWDPRSLPRDQWRRLIGVVPQRVRLFEGTVLDNIRLGAEGISRDAAWAALELSSAADLVRSLPDGLDTRLGATGLSLSNGQMQLLALARALAGNPRVLLLDEATSSVDSETERLIRQGLTRGARGRTTLTVAHRLAAALEADRVFVISRGRILEEGPPAALAEGEGWFAGMLELQRLGWADA